VTTPLQKVKSSSISHVGHDPATRTLSVKFTNGATYNYKGVSAEQHARLLAADSIGTHFQTSIRSKHKATRIG
jgi:hypothetical protein